MKAAGIIAEYNPLHNGHVFHIEQTRALTGADAVIAAMSGDFVQRGEAAITDKRERTLHALGSGVDLVIEIPALFALGNAGQFARAGVCILESLGKVSHISFGSESADIEALKRVAGIIKDHKDDLEKLIEQYSDRGISYPAARAKAYADLTKEFRDCDGAEDRDVRTESGILSEPNDILALEYIMAMRKAEPLAIPREGAGYSDAFNSGFKYQSASAIRARIFEGRDTGSYMPEAAADSIRKCHLTGPDRDEWFNLLRYAILSADTETIEDCPSGGEGLANLLKSNAAAASSWPDLISLVKSKRYTYTRLSRLCMQLVLGITRTEYNINEPKYVRILGFSEKGRRLLAEIRDEGCAGLPLVTNVNKSMQFLDSGARRLLELDMHAADIYNLATGRDMQRNSDRRLSPIVYI